MMLRGLIESIRGGGPGGGTGFNGLIALLLPLPCPLPPRSNLGSLAPLPSCFRYVGISSAVAKNTEWRFDPVIPLDVPLNLITWVSLIFFQRVEGRSGSSAIPRLSLSK